MTAGTYPGEPGSRTGEEATLHAVSSAVLAVTRHLSVREVLQVIVRAAARLLDARYAALGVPDDQGSFAEFVVEGVSSAQWDRIGPMPRQHGMLAAMLRDNEPKRLADIRRAPEFEGWPAAHPVLKDFLGVPIRDGDQVLGIIFLANRRQPSSRPPTVCAYASGTCTSSTCTSGPAPSGLATSAPAPSAPATSGPATSGLATSGPATGGPATSGPATSGPATSGPATSGPATSGPATGGPAPSGPAAGGAATGDSGAPSSDGTPSGGGASGGGGAVGGDGASGEGGAPDCTEAGPGFCARDEELLTLFAAHAAIAITNARLYEANRELTVVAERTRLARELHDAVAQKLFSLRLTARAASALAERDPARAVQELDQVEKLAADALAELRAVIFELRPADLADGLAASLRKHAEVLDRAFDARVVCDADGAVGLPEEAELGLFRIAQEALHNALRHAGASTVRVRLASAADAVTLEIADDGRGFTPSDTPAKSDTPANRAGVGVRNGAGNGSGKGDTPGSGGPNGLGLDSMRDRAHSIGGTLSIDTAPGRGTVVRVEVAL